MARIAGHKGSLYLGGVKVADLYDVTIEITTDIQDATIKLETFGRKVPGIANGRITAARRINTTALLAREALDSGQLGEQLAFAVHTIDANGSFTQITGTCFVSQGQFSLPADAADDRFEAIIDGTITWSLPGAS